MRMTDAPRNRVAGAGGLYLVLTEPLIPHRVLVEHAVERGVRFVQLREKSLTDRQLLRLAGSLRDITSGSTTLLIINDRADIAAAVEADGVHVGPQDIDVTSARRIVGGDAIVGVSTNTLTQAESAPGSGADYVAVGPVFPTTTKVDARPPIGLDGVTDRARAVGSFPMVAIGGIDAANAPDVIAAGADLVAVVSAICRAPDPLGAIDSFLAAISETENGR